MHYLALATDYDGTLATEGRVATRTLAALVALRASGRKAILVTGRELPDLIRVCECLPLFAAVVAENGAVYYRPGTGEKFLLTTPPPALFATELRRRGVEPVSVGDVILATRSENSQAVLEAIHDCKLELQLIFNKESLMVLPTGVNKATGLRFALERLELGPEQVVGIGDAENDHSLLKSCAMGVAVANALASLKAVADWVTPSEAGDGVTELIDRMIESDLALTCRSG